MRAGGRVFMCMCMCVCVMMRAAAAYNLRPPVVPEFRKITVGGSIAGIAGESSSFKHGFFHDACTGYEIITGDGRCVRERKRGRAIESERVRECAQERDARTGYEIITGDSLGTHLHIRTHAHTHCVSL